VGKRRRPSPVPPHAARHRQLDPGSPDQMTIPRSAGYSGTPLAKKLGIKPGSRVFVSGAPGNYRRLLDPLPNGVSFENAPGPGIDMVHVFVTDKQELSGIMQKLRKQLDSSAALWVSWPKKTARVVTTVGEDGIRALAIPLGLVDVKVCAVDEVWSGLKLVVRKQLRRP
jgi:hypothetical protein